MKLPLLLGAAQSRSPIAAAERRINLYPEIIATGGKEPGVLYGCPGLTSKVTFTDGPVQGALNANGVLYVVSGGVLYEVSTAWVATNRGSIGTIARVTMADNGTQLIISSGHLYTYATTTLAAITDADWPAGDVQFIDGYFLANLPGTGRVQISNSYDGATWDTLDFTTSEGSADDVVGHIANGREWWVFNERSVEVYYNSGASFPFERIAGAFIEQGCAAAASIAKIDSTVYWLSRNSDGAGLVMRATGYTPERISTHAIEYQIGKWTSLSDAYAWVYQQEGHSFYCLTSPSADETWCFDASTQLWHQRAYFSGGAFARHRANCAVGFNNTVLVGDHTNGTLWELDLGVFLDGADTHKWLAAVRMQHNEGRRLTVSRLELDMETGHGLTSGQGSDPKVMLRVSRDGGQTWGNEHWTSSGKIGKYSRRAIWRRLGVGRDFVFEFSGTDPVRIALVGAYVDVVPGAS